MKVNYTAQPQHTSPQAFYEFARMNSSEKALVLKKSGLLLDKDQEKGQSVNLYFLNGFFVEETISRKENKVDIIPYKHGYRLESYVEVKQVLVPKRNIGR